MEIPLMVSRGVWPSNASRRVRRAGRRESLVIGSQAAEAISSVRQSVSGSRPDRPKRRGMKGKNND